MRYRVHGIHRGTGAETILVVEAKHHEAAEAIAQRQMIVSQVIPEGGLAEPGVFDWERPKDPNDLASAVAQAAADGKNQSQRPTPAPRWRLLALIITATIAAAALLGWWK